MNQHHYSYFVVAAIVAAELHRAMQVARDIALTASNARALALRAGQGAAGFRAITDFIDNLAATTVDASQAINEQAVKMSRIASDTVRSESALQRFDKVYTKAANATHLSSLNPAYTKTKSSHGSYKALFDHQVKQLASELEELGKELRTATVLAAMSRVEASQSGIEFEQPLNVVAQSVADAAREIQRCVSNAQQLIFQLT